MDTLSFSVFPNDNFLDLRLYQFGWEQCGPLQSFGPFIRNHYLFHYVISGRGVLLSNDAEDVTRRYELGPGEGFLICPDQVNTYCADESDPWKYAWLEFDGLRAADSLACAGLGVSQPIYRPGSAAQGAAIEERMLYIADHSGASAMHLIGHLFLFLDCLIQFSSTRRDPAGGQLQDFYIQEAVTFIKQNYQRSITVDEIAGICKLNRSYFSRMFKDVVGCTPQTFLIRLRLTHAAEQMKTTNDPIGEIALRCGYSNPLHFSQAFKQHYGLPPREWRKRNQPVDRRT